MLRALGLGPAPTLVLLGGTSGLSPALDERLCRLVSQGIARAAAACGAVLLDGMGSQGLMALLGQGVEDRGAGTTLVGVVPAERVVHPDGDGRLRLDPHHSHFVLADDVSALLPGLAEHLGARVPPVVVVVQGDEATRHELLQVVRRGWQVVLLQGSGGLADQLAGLLRERADAIEDPLLAELVAEGDFTCFPPEGRAPELGRLLEHCLGQGELLRVAWSRFALYDANAKRQQATFDALQRWILLLGFMSTVLALFKSSLVGMGGAVRGDAMNTLLHTVVVTLTAAVTALVAAVSRFKVGNRWVQLRASAEMVKGELYRYRCRLLQGADVAATREARLASWLRSSSQQLLETDASLSALRPYPDDAPLPPPRGVAAGDDGFSALTPSRYLKLRLEDQLAFYRSSARRCSAESTRLQCVTLIFGAASTVLAALQLEQPVAIASALVLAIGGYLGQRQLDALVMKHNRAATELDCLSDWWRGLSAEERKDPRSFTALVSGTELVLQGELTGWVQQMRDVLNRLQAQQAPPPRTEPQHRPTPEAQVRGASA
ncbi:DUF4231 domain-containing protein [Pyxidicoccus sp. QH1ED-7-1]|nr:DUF4231 domain-containing protein [Pyxidicoccus xibeiensis]